MVRRCWVLPTSLSYLPSCPLLQKTPSYLPMGLITPPPVTPSPCHPAAIAWSPLPGGLSSCPSWSVCPAKSPAKWRCDGTLATDKVARGLLMECMDGRPVLSTLAMSCSWSSLVKQTHYPHVGTLCQVAGFHQHESSSAPFLC